MYENMTNIWLCKGFSLKNASKSMKASKTNVSMNGVSKRHEHETEWNF